MGDNDAKYRVEETTGHMDIYYKNKATVAGHPGPWRDFGTDRRSADEYAKQVKNSKR